MDRRHVLCAGLNSYKIGSQSPGNVVCWWLTFYFRMLIPSGTGSTLSCLLSLAPSSWLTSALWSLPPSSGVFIHNRGWLGLWLSRRTKESEELNPVSVRRSVERQQKWKQKEQSSTPPPLSHLSQTGKFNMYFWWQGKGSQFIFAWKVPQIPNLKMLCK